MPRFYEQKARHSALEIELYGKMDAEARRIIKPISRTNQPPSNVFGSRAWYLRLDPR